jgi:hypothetical protein
MVFPVKSLAVIAEKNMLITCNSTKQNIKFTLGVNPDQDSTKNVQYFDAPGRICLNTDNDVLNNKIPCDANIYKSKVNLNGDNIFYMAVTKGAVCPMELHEKVNNILSNIFNNWKTKSIPYIITPDLIADVCVLSMSTNASDPLSNTYDDKRKNIYSKLGGVNKCRNILIALQRTVDELIIGFNDPNVDYNTLLNYVDKFSYIFLCVVISNQNNIAEQICKFWTDNQNLRICEFSDALHVFIREVFRRLIPRQAKGYGISQFAINLIIWIENCIQLILSPMNQDREFVQLTQIISCGNQLFACSGLFSQAYNELQSVNLSGSLLNNNLLINLLTEVLSLSNEIFSLNTQFETLNTQFETLINGFNENVPVADLSNMISELSLINQLFPKVNQLNGILKQYAQLLPQAELLEFAACKMRDYHAHMKFLLTSLLANLYSLQSLEASSSIAAGVGNELNFNYGLPKEPYDQFFTGSFDSMSQRADYRNRKSLKRNTKKGIKKNKKSTLSKKNRRRKTKKKSNTKKSRKNSLLKSTKKVNRNKILRTKII